jgi:uncharacterized surface protein with fasciclin (FAS1) repeats
MQIRHRAAALVATAGLAVGALAAAPSAGASNPSAAKAATGTTPIAAVLTSDGNKFDKNWGDFDIVTEAALAVLAAKPKSKVGVITKGGTAITVFAPTDRAFQRLVTSLTGKTPKTERATFAAVASLGIPTVEKVLLYHVIPGATITSAQAVKANGATLRTALGSTITVAVYGGPEISLWDKDRNARNPRVILAKVDVNKGNKQIAHGINNVLRPLDLPPLAHGS